MSAPVSPEVGLAEALLVYFARKECGVACEEIAGMVFADADAVGGVRIHGPELSDEMDDYDVAAHAVIDATLSALDSVGITARRADT